MRRAHHRPAVALPRRESFGEGGHRLSPRVNGTTTTTTYYGSIDITTTSTVMDDGDDAVRREPFDITPSVAPTQAAPAPSPTTRATTLHGHDVKRQRGGGAGKRSSRRTCFICLDDLLEDQDEDGGGDVELGLCPTTMTRVAGCDHHFCRSCLKRSLETDIEDKKVPCPCPMAVSTVKRCNNHRLDDAFVTAILTDRSWPVKKKATDERKVSTRDDVTGLLSTGEWPTQVQKNDADEGSPITTTKTTTTTIVPRSLEKYRRLVALKQNPQSVECVRCHDVFIPTRNDRRDDGHDDDDDDGRSSFPWCCGRRHLPATTSTTTTTVTCPRCDHVFCRAHGDAHPGLSCRAWLLRTDDGRRVQKTESKLTRATRPCPSCSIRIQKVEGCDFVQCRNCHQHMCWLCNRKLEEAHQAHYCPRMWSMIVLAILGYLLWIVVWIPVALALAVASGCCGCGQWLQREREAERRCAPLRTVGRVLTLVGLPLTILCIDVGDRYPRVEATWAWLEFEVKEAWRKLNARDAIPVMPVVVRTDDKEEEQEQQQQPKP